MAAPPASSLRRESLSIASLRIKVWHRPSSNTSWMRRISLVLGCCEPTLSTAPAGSPAAQTGARSDRFFRIAWPRPVAFNLYSGFVRAKALAREKLVESIPSALFFGPEYLTRTQEIIGEDPFPYGIKANEAMLETITAYSYEQGLTPKKMNFKELFAD